jgi:hypothetical protein
MPIDFNSSITQLSKKTFGNTFLSGLLGNTISISFVISLVIVLIIMIMYPAKSGTKFTIFAKMMIYIYFSVLLLVFLHDSIVKYKVKENLERDIDEDNINSMTGGDDLIYKTNRISPALNAQQTQQQQQINQSDKKIKPSTTGGLEEPNDTYINTGGDDRLPPIKGGNGNVNIFAL